MERLKLAISKARDTAIQGQLEQQPRPMAGDSPRPFAAAPAWQAEPKRSSWKWLPVLLGLAAVAAFWATRPDPDAEQADTAPEQQVATATPPQPVEPALPADTGSAPPANADEPAVALAAAPIEAVKPSVPLNDQVKAAVENWRQAWSKRDMKAYLGAYSEAFKPRAGMSRADWVASRYRNVGGRKSIDVQINDLQIEILGDDHARVSFLQDYTSGSSRERAQPKTLDLVRDADERWRIVGEWQGDPPPFAGKEAS